MAEASRGDWVTTTLSSPNVQRASAGLSFVDSATESRTTQVIDGKITNRQLAQRIGVSESVVGIWLRKLTGGGVLVFTAIIDWEAAVCLGRWDLRRRTA